jgi:hypothetical protein
LDLDAEIQKIKHEATVKASKEELMEKEVAQRPVKKPIENKPAAVAAPI